MVRRFITTNHYPSGYPAHLADDQSSVPSQHSETPPAFDPSQQPDIRPTPAPSVPEASIVRAVFDSRPPFAYDFFFEDRSIDQVDGSTPFTGYVVPLGYLLFLRKVVISLYPFTSPTGVGQPVMNAFGDVSINDFPSGVNVQILIDNAPAPDWTIGTVTLFDLFTADVEINTFIKILGGSQINLNLNGITGLDAKLVTYVHYYGNMLLSTGRVLSNEVGNQYPLPVIEVIGG
jgi:hypothetical protein